MRKLLLLSILFTSLMSAQDFRLGAKGGLDVTMIAVELDGSQSTATSGTGFYAGLFGEIGLSDEYNIQIEGLYTSADEFNTIAIPLSLERNFSEKWAAQAGLQGDIILEDLGEDVNTFSLGLLIGASYNINEDFVIEGRYIYGLTSLVEDATYRLSFLQVGIGYRFL